MQRNLFAMGFVCLLTCLGTTISGQSNAATPQLDLRYPAPGTSAAVSTFKVAGATPGDIVVFVIGLTPGEVVAPGVGTFGIADLQIFTTVQADDRGEAEFQLFIPDGLGGAVVLLQAFEYPTLTVSPVVTWDIPRYNHPGITTGCYGCHQQDYENAISGWAELSHEQRGYPTSCEDCHYTRTTFEGAIFPHPEGQAPGCINCHAHQFSVAGNHTEIGVPSSLCHDCHDPDLGTFCISLLWDWHEFRIGLYGHGPSKHPIHAPGTFTCPTCHQGTPPWPGEQKCLTCHQQAPTTSRHSAIGGFSWSAPACVNCHPTGLLGGD